MPCLFVMLNAVSIRVPGNGPRLGQSRVFNLEDEAIEQGEMSSSGWPGIPRKSRAVLGIRRARSILSCATADLAAGGLWGDLTPPNRSQPPCRLPIAPGTALYPGL